MNDELIRADAALVARGLAGSREKARSLIEAGLVTLNGAKVDKPARKVGPGDALVVLGETHPYVSRGGLKLEKALRVFKPPVEDRICIDVGASTGGFTDVLLRNGAGHVYAIDVGTGQLHPSLLADPRVTSMEKVNARTLDASMFPLAPTLAVMDVSFISIRLILPALVRTLGDSGRIITLVKPQFEAGRARVGKGGIVSKAETHRQVLREIAGFVPTLGWHVRGLDYSPIAGGDGNLEYLADLVPEAVSDHLITLDEIDEVVRRSHDEFKARG